MKAFVVVLGVLQLFVGIAEAKDVSGKSWCAKFPDITDVDRLEGEFKTNFKKFKAAMDASGASTKVNSVVRPQERAYLMHWSWLIAKEGKDPQKIPALAGVDVEWWHGTKEASVTAAQEMVDGYEINGLETAPALDSNHTKGKAVDMSTSWSGDLKIKDATGKEITITSSPRDSTNKDLIDVAATYKVIHFLKVEKDKNHWSIDGK